MEIDADKHWLICYVIENMLHELKYQESSCFHKLGPLYYILEREQLLTSSEENGRLFNPFPNCNDRRKIFHLLTAILSSMTTEISPLNPVKPLKKADRDKIYTLVKDIIDAVPSQFSMIFNEKINVFVRNDLPEEVCQKIMEALQSYGDRVILCRTENGDALRDYKWEM